MSGYFSRIARQGGARIAGDRGQRMATPAAKREPQLAPIDVEETVMVTPHASSDSPAARQHKPNVDAMGQDYTRADHTRTDHTRAPKPAELSTSGINPATQISSPEATGRKPFEPVVEEVKIIKPEVTPHASHVPVSFSPTRKTETLKPIVSEEPARKILPDPRSPEALPEKSTEKKFFEKTVEIVEGQTARPAEVHTILLREVQEWIAAGQTAAEEVTAGVTDSVAEPLTDLSQPSEQPEPGVVRIGESRRTKTVPQPIHEVSTTDFSEQHFELSIGSISVVVEGDERTPAPAPAQVAAQPAARETTHRTSRLSRHYL